MTPLHNTSNYLKVCAWPRTVTRGALRTLAATASQRGGYFTAKQAREAGYDYPHLEHHLKVGNFQRIGHGLYRLSENDELIRLA